MLQSNKFNIYLTVTVIIVTQISCKALFGNLVPNEAVNTASNFATAWDRDVGRKQCKEYKVLLLETDRWDKTISPADKLNGITEKITMRVERACISEWTNSYIDIVTNILLGKQNSNWCILIHDSLEILANPLVRYESDKYLCK